MKLEINKKQLKETLSPFESLSSQMKKDLVIKMEVTESETFFYTQTEECSLRVKSLGKSDGGGRMYLSLDKVVSALKKFKKGTAELSLRLLNGKAILLDESLEQIDVSADTFDNPATASVERVEVGVIETLPLEKGLLEVSRTIAKSNTLYQVLEQAKFVFDEGELKIVSFDEDALTIKRINVSNNNLHYLFYLTKGRVDLLNKVLKTMTDTYLNVLCSRDGREIYLTNASVEVKMPVIIGRDVQLEKVSDLNGKFLATTLEVVMSDLRETMPRRALTEEEVKKFTEIVQKSKPQTARWIESATNLKLGAPIYSMADTMLQPFFCQELGRLRFRVSGSKQELTHQSFNANLLIQTIKDSELESLFVKIPTDLTEPLAIIYQDDVSSMERYFMLTREE